MSIDLRIKLDDFFKNNGNDVLYIRNSKYINCRCYKHNTKEGDVNCKICFGSGKLTSLEKTKIIMDVNTIRSGRENYTKIGIEDNSIIYAYMPFNTNPRQNDLVCLTGWNGNAPSNINKVYKIRNAIDVRCDDGRIEAFYCILERAEEYDSALNEYVKKLPPLAIRTLNKGGKWVCPK